MGRTLTRVAAIAALAAAALAGAEPARSAPTAGRIAYVHQRSEGYYTLTTIRPDGTGVRRVVNPRRGYPRPTLPRFSPDGKQLAFATIGVQPGLHKALWLATPAGKRQREVPLDLEQPFLVALSWAPAGRRLIMAEARSVVEDQRMHIVRTDGSRRRELGRGRNPVWSPDGRWIAFEADDGVWIVRPNGEQRQLLAPATAVGGLAFSPSGRRLLFTRVEFDRSSAVEWWIVPVAGGEARRVVTKPPRWRCPPQWTPDGKRLAGMRIDSDPDGIGHRYFVTTRLDGSDERVEFRVPELSIGDDPCDFSWQRRLR